MKYTIMLVLLLLGSLVANGLRAQAPIPNGGFEQWVGGNPSEWFVDNSDHWSPVSQTTDAHGGTWALKGTVLDLGQGIKESPIAISGPSSLQFGFQYTDRPLYFTGYYKFTSSGEPGDILTITANFWGSTAGMANSVFEATTTVDHYVYFSVPIDWQSSGQPDSAAINMTITGPDGNTQNARVGSTMYIDDLAFKYQQSGVPANEKLLFALEQNSPNPTAAYSTIGFTLDKPGFTTLTLYDITGRAVASPVNGYLTEGRHVAGIDGAGLPAGVYTYQLVSQRHTTLRQMQVVK